MAKFVAIIDANNFPVYFYSCEEDDSIENHFVAEMALDFIDAQFARSATTSSLLLVHDGVAVYGNVSNTNIKVFIGVRAHEHSDLNLDPMFKAIQDCYVRHICNPFYDTTQQTITSSSFDAKIKQVLIAD